MLCTIQIGMKKFLKSLVGIEETSLEKVRGYASPGLHLAVFNCMSATFVLSS